MMFVVFDCLRADLQKIKYPQFSHEWFLINYGRLVN